MLKRFGVPLLLLVAVGVLIYFIARPKPTPTVPGNSLPRTTNSTQKDWEREEGPQGVDLLLKTMEIIQGEKGIKVWRLETSWANMDKKDGLITAERPRLVYYMPPDDRELVVTSDHGDVNQEGGILRFISNVNAAFEQRTVKGSLLVYNGTSKSMTFPNGGYFTGTGMEGSADKITWHMGQNEIEAESNVHVIFEPTRTSAEKQ